MGPAQPSSPLVGRSEELARLQAALETALGGAGTAAFVRGESGVGKSRLLTEVAATAESRGMTVLAGSAIDIGEAAPFWPLRLALRRFLRDGDNAWALDRLAPWQAHLTALVPGIPAGTGPAAPASSEQTTMDVLVQVVAALAGGRPLALLLDDMHWADVSSRQLLMYLLATLTDEPVLLVVAYRDDLGEDRPVHELALEVQRSRRGALLELRPLDRSAVAQLVPGGDEGLVSAVHAWSGGNVLLVEEIVRSLQDGALFGVPGSVRELVRMRVGRLPEPSRRVVDALAVGDEPVPHRLLAAVLLDVPDLDHALRSAVRTGLVQVDEDGEGYRLPHGVVREVVRGDLLPGERYGLHRSYATALGDSALPDFRRTARLAAHWSAAQDWPEALAATSTAAEEAEDAFGFAEAHDLWTQAVALSGRLRRVATRDDALLERAARAAHLAGEHDEALTLVGRRLAAVPAGAGETAARVHDQWGQYLSAAGRHHEAVAAHAAGVALLPDDIGPEVRASVLAGYAAALEDVGRYADAEQQARTALAAADAAGSAALRARVLPTLGFSLAHLGDAESGLAAVERGLRAAEEAGGAQDIGCAHLRRCELLCGPLNRLAEGVRAGQDAIAVAADLGLSRTVGVRLQVFVANALFRTGDWDAAQELVDVALAARPTGAAAMELRLARCRLLLGRGDLDAAEHQLDALEALSLHAGAPSLVVPLLTLRAGSAMWRRQVSVAREHVRRGVESVRADSDDVWLVAPLVWHGVRAEAEARVRPSGRRRGPDLERVAALRAQIEDLARRADAAAPGVRTIVLGYLRLCEAEASRIDGVPDPAAWRRAAAVWEANTHPYPAAYCRLRLAEALLAGRTGAAGALDALLTAHRTAARLGARPLLAEIQALARSAGVDLPTAAEDDRPAPAPAPPDTVVLDLTDGPEADEDWWSTLTNKERLVLAGVAEGRTNRQIGRRLGISEKTVSVHVSHVLAKLGVQTRVQAAMAVHRSTAPQLVRRAAGERAD